MANNVTVESYLFFPGRCEEAVKFYTTVLGAVVHSTTKYKDSPDPASRPPGMDDKVLHVLFQVGETKIMASDSPTPVKGHEGFALCLNVQSEADARRYFDALAKGGKVNMPLGKTFFAPLFGMVEDKFGIQWMVYLMAKT